MKNFKKSSFKRTSPTEESLPVNGSMFTCGKCTFKTGTQKRMKEHIDNAHKVPQNIPNINTKTGDTERRSQNLPYCHNWNNKGSCNFETRTGRPCKFLHKTAPICSFDGICDRKFCMYVHQNQNMAFLAKAPQNAGPPMMQNTYWGAPPPWMNQFQGPWQEQRRGNTRQY